MRHREIDRVAADAAGGELALAGDAELPRRGRRQQVDAAGVDEEPRRLAVDRALDVDVVVDELERNPRDAVGGVDARGRRHRRHREVRVGDRDVDFVTVDAQLAALARIGAAGRVGGVVDEMERQAQAVDVAPVVERRGLRVLADALLRAREQMRLRVEPERDRIAAVRRRDDDVVAAAAVLARLDARVARGDARRIPVRVRGEPGLAARGPLRFRRVEHGDLAAGVALPRLPPVVAVGAFDRPERVAADRTPGHEVLRAFEMPVEATGTQRPARTQARDRIPACAAARVLVAREHGGRVLGARGAGAEQQRDGESERKKRLRHERLPAASLACVPHCLNNRFKFQKAQPNRWHGPTTPRSRTRRRSRCSPRRRASTSSTRSNRSAARSRSPSSPRNSAGRRTGCTTTCASSPRPA
ncbi:MAG TPA: hypothetical protein VGC30_01585 [Dokdonella sp.]